jgi:hypothetical protein
MIGPLVLGIFLGLVVEFVFSFAWVLGRFRRLREEPCSACGRPSAVLTQVVDLETREQLAASILCAPCLHHVRKVTVESPAPWASNWK